MFQYWRAAAAVVLVASWAQADESECPHVAEADQLVRCAQSGSEAVIKARQAMEAARARRIVAGQLLPSNPTLEVGGGRRQADSGAVDTDRSIELSQTIAIGGQRGARVAGADAEVATARSVLEAVEREIAADVLAAATSVWRARLGVAFAREQQGAAARFREVSGARAQQGVSAAIDQDLADAAQIQALRDAMIAAQELRETELRLAFVVGRDVQLASDARVETTFEPPGEVELETHALDSRAEVAQARGALAMERARTEVLRRERVPDVTLVAGIRHEEFSNVLGGRISLPIPLFYRNQGQIAEQEARVGSAQAEAQQTELRTRLEARAAYEAWRRASEIARAIAPDLEERLRNDVTALQRAYERGSLPLTTALASLRETQAARRTVLDSRTDAILASLRLARAAGYPLPGWSKP